MARGLTRLNYKLGQNHYKKSKMYRGRICLLAVSSTGISVDNFTGSHVKSRAFFISHFHIDHVQGLESDALIYQLWKNNAVIYTTEITMAIIKQQYEGWAVVKYVKALNSGCNVITLPSVPEKNQEELLLDVTLIPAGHSLGSTMFLFKIPGKTVLYTGDFRIRINDIPKYTKLHDENGDPIHIDAMYVDTTFIDKAFEDFPKRSETVDTVIDEMEKWLKEGDNRAVAVYLPANYTFEFICKKIFERLDMKIFVDSRRWPLYCGIPELVPSITDDRNSKVHVCSRTYPGAVSYCAHDEDLEYLHVRLTAMRWSNYNLDHTPIERVTPGQLLACFATHCSRRELISFVQYFAPAKVVGFPNVYREGTPPSTPVQDYAPSPKRKSSTKRSEDGKRRLISSETVSRKISL